MDAWTIAFSPDSRFLASGSHTGKINLFGVDSGRKETSLDTRGKFTLSIAYVCVTKLMFKLSYNTLNKAHMLHIIRMVFVAAIKIPSIYMCVCARAHHIYYKLLISLVGKCTKTFSPADCFISLFCSQSNV